jgi:hypothetical protein
MKEFKAIITPKLGIDQSSRKLKLVKMELTFMTDGNPHDLVEHVLGCLFMDRITQVEFATNLP